MLSVGKSYLLYDKIDSQQDIYDKIESITAEELLEVSNEILNNANLTTLMYK
jgi:predicted Zn-dependent peptidase